MECNFDGKTEPTVTDPWGGKTPDDIKREIMQQLQDEKEPVLQKAIAEEVLPQNKDHPFSLHAWKGVEGTNRPDV